MDVHLAILQLKKNHNQYTVKADGSGINEWRSSEPQPTQAELDQAWSDYQAAQAATKYQRDRAAEYPSVVDQLDDIYHNGVDGWKATIKATKDKYPKP
tara:strand:- start:430 stop:723 length:294 start_codon:yes stop_codon:yes gene_type:complete